MNAATRRIVAAACSALALSTATFASAEDTVVFAAASLKEALTEATDAWAAQGNPKPVLSFAASSALAKQIEHGAPAALFVSADEQWMTYLADRSLLAADSRSPLLRNELVLIAPTSRPLSIAVAPGFALASALEGGKLAMADVNAVPAGRYGRQALSSLGVWTSVEPNVVLQPDVRAALALVERDEARAGIVYRTDALVSTRVTIVGAFPESSHEPIVYALAIVSEHDSPEARGLRAFLLSETVSSILTRHGFLAR